MIQQWLGIKQVPAIKENIEDEPDAMAISVKWKELLRRLYACPSPKRKRGVKDSEYKMIIELGAELC